MLGLINDTLSTSYGWAEAAAAAETAWEGGGHLIPGSARAARPEMDDQVRGSGNHLSYSFFRHSSPGRRGGQDRGRRRGGAAGGEEEEEGKGRTKLYTRGKLGRRKGRPA